MIDSAIENIGPFKTLKITRLGIKQTKKKAGDALVEVGHGADIGEGAGVGLGFGVAEVDRGGREGWSGRRGRVGGESSRERRRREERWVVTSPLTTSRSNVCLGRWMVIYKLNGFGTIGYGSSKITPDLFTNRVNVFGSGSRTLVTIPIY